MPRFALLWHDCPAEYNEGPHWDLMLERPGVELEQRLATWSLRTLPGIWCERLGLEVLGSMDQVIAIALPDHRATYLDYEGPVSGDRGEVTQVASGGIAWNTLGDQKIEVNVAATSVLAGGILLEKSRPENAWTLTVTA